MPYVSPGPGTLGHLVSEYWAEKEMVRLAHATYKGSGQAMNDLVAGYVKLGALTWTAALGQMKMSPAELTAFIKDDLAKWPPLAKRLIPAEGRR